MHSSPELQRIYEQYVFDYGISDKQINTQAMSHSDHLERNWYTPSSKLFSTLIRNKDVKNVFQALRVYSQTFHIKIN